MNNRRITEPGEVLERVQVAIAIGLDDFLFEKIERFFRDSRVRERVEAQETQNFNNGLLKETKLNRDKSKMGRDLHVDAFLNIRHGVLQIDASQLI